MTNPIDLLTGREHPAANQHTIIGAHPCECSHSHRLRESGRMEQICVSCDCESYRRHVTEGA